MGQELFSEFSNPPPFQFHVASYVAARQKSKGFIHAGVYWCEFIPSPTEKNIHISYLHCWLEALTSVGGNRRLY